MEEAQRVPQEEAKPTLRLTVLRRVVLPVTAAALVLTTAYSASWGWPRSSSLRSDQLRGSRRLAATENASEIIRYPVVFRDFEGNDAFRGITMFGDVCTYSSEMVEPRLGEDGKPVWKGVVGEGGISSREQFDLLWNTDPEINTEVLGELDFSRSPDGNFRHDSPEFFPLDTEGGERNYFFTMELHSTFTYQGGERFNFRGDDDVYLFINGTLVVNLGGCHSPMVAELDVDSLNLTRGEAYPFDFFFAERRCCGSSLRIETTLQLDEPEEEEVEEYRCCVTHIISYRWSWLCFEDRKFFWCAADGEAETSSEEDATR